LTTTVSLILLPLFFYSFVILLYFSLSKRHFHKPLSLSLIITGLYWLYEAVFEETGLMSFAGFSIWLLGFIIFHSSLYQVVPEQEETFEGFLFDRPTLDVRELAFRLVGIFLMMIASYFFIHLIVLSDFFSRVFGILSFLVLVASFLLISGNYGYLLFLIPISITFFVAFILSFIILRFLGVI